MILVKRTLNPSTQSCSHSPTCLLCLGALVLHGRTARQRQRVEASILIRITTITRVSIIGTLPDYSFLAIATVSIITIMAVITIMMVLKLVYATTIILVATL